VRIARQLSIIHALLLATRIAQFASIPVINLNVLFFQDNESLQKFQVTSFFRSQSLPSIGSATLLDTMNRVGIISLPRRISNITSPMTDIGVPLAANNLQSAAQSEACGINFLGIIDLSQPVSTRKVSSFRPTNALI